MSEFGQTFVVGDTYSESSDVPSGGTTWTQSVDGVTWTANQQPTKATANPDIPCTTSVTISGSIKDQSGTLTITHTCPESGTQSLLSSLTSSISSFVNSVATAVVNWVTNAANVVAAGAKAILDFISNALVKEHVSDSHSSDASFASSATTHIAIGHDTVAHAALHFH